jgi:hypothetical protein
VLDSVRSNVMGAPRRLADAVNVGVSGGSAGGLATYFHADYIAARVPAKGLVYALPRSGFFMDLVSVGTGTLIYGGEMRAVHAMTNASTSARCEADFPDSTWLCQFAQFVYPRVSTPTFLLQSVYDSWQTRCILSSMPVDPSQGRDSYNCSAAPGWGQCALNVSDCTAAQVLDSIVPFGAALASSVLSLSANKSTAPGSGGFLDSCHMHVESDGGAWNSVSIGGVSMEAAFAAWLADNIAAKGRAPAAKHWRKDCEYTGARMCNPTCPNS